MGELRWKWLEGGKTFVYVNLKCDNIIIKMCSVCVCREECDFTCKCTMCDCRHEQCRAGHQVSEIMCR